MTNIVKVALAVFLLVALFIMTGVLVAFSFNQFADWLNFGWDKLDTSDGIGIFLTSCFFALWARLLLIISGIVREGGPTVIKFTPPKKQ